MNLKVQKPLIPSVIGFQAGFTCRIFVMRRVSLLAFPNLKLISLSQLYVFHLHKTLRGYQSANLFYLGSFEKCDGREQMNLISTYNKNL